MIYRLCDSSSQCVHQDHSYITLLPFLPGTTMLPVLAVLFHIKAVAVLTVSKFLLTEASELNRYLEQLVAVLTLKKPTLAKEFRTNMYSWNDYDFWPYFFPPPDPPVDKSCPPLGYGILEQEPHPVQTGDKQDCPVKMEDCPVKMNYTHEVILLTCGNTFPRGVFDQGFGTQLRTSRGGDQKFPVCTPKAAY